MDKAIPQKNGGSIDSGGNKKEEQPTTVTHLLDYQGLVQVIELIERMRQEGHFAMWGREMTCEPEEDGYDENQPAVEKTSEVKS